jgi:hypothetical protein
MISSEAMDGKKEKQNHSYSNEICKSKFKHKRKNDSETVYSLIL